MPDPHDPGIASLEGLRATIRERLLITGDTLAGAGDEDSRYVAGELERLVNAYRGLGGDLELTPRAVVDDVATRADTLVRAAADLSAEDFPPRLAGLVDPLNELAAALATRGAA